MFCTRFGVIWISPIIRPVAYRRINFANIVKYTNQMHEGAFTEQMTTIIGDHQCVFVGISLKVIYSVSPNLLELLKLRRLEDRVDGLNI